MKEGRSEFQKKNLTVTTLFAGDFPAPTPVKTNKNKQASSESPMSVESGSSGESSLSYLVEDCVADFEELQHTANIDVSRISEASDLSDLFLETQKN